MADFSERNRDEEALRLLISPLSDDYSPSISDKTKAGYFSQDCSSQTERSDVVNLKDMTNVVGVLVKDLSVLKKSLYFARHVLEADYKTKLEERALHLYCRVNDRILDLEKMHQERVVTIRRSFKQQLSDALVKIANESEKISQSIVDRNAKLACKRQEEELRKQDKGQVVQQQQAMILMLKTQLEEQQERFDSELADVLNRDTPSSFDSHGERDILVAQIAELEGRLDDMESAMGDVKSENKQLMKEVDDLSDQLEREREIISRLKHDLSRADNELKEAGTNIKIKLEQQKAELERECENKILRLKEDFDNSTRRQLDDYKFKQKMKLKEQGLINQKLLEEATKKQEQDVIPETEKDSVIRRLRQIEKDLRTELANLRKEFERANRTWEMKVSILKQSIHALRDEAFLRATLQRQTSKLRLVSVQYTNDGPVIIPVERIPANQRFQRLPVSAPGEANKATIPDIVPKGGNQSGKDV